jgi:peroxiredoxin
MRPVSAVPALVIACTLSVALVAPASAEVLKPGAKAPDFQLRDLQQTLVRFSRFAAKKVVVLDFFRTDCNPCVKSLGKLKALHKRFGSNKQNVRFLLVAMLERNEGEKKLSAFLGKAKLPFPVLVDAYDSVAKKFISKANSVQLPSLFVIGKKGKVRWRHTSLLSDAKVLEKAIKSAL